jgi:hypothetical protein
VLCIKLFSFPPRLLPSVISSAQQGDRIPVRNIWTGFREVGIICKCTMCDTGTLEVCDTFILHTSCVYVLRMYKQARIHQMHICYMVILGNKTTYNLSSWNKNYVFS